MTFCKLSLWAKGKILNQKTRIESDKNLYWDAYYLKQNKSPSVGPPSQFAAFCLSELGGSGIRHLVDIASGNGRDAIFFARQDLNVLAVERNDEAARLIEANTLGFSDLEVRKLDVTKETIETGFKNSPIIAFYSRFFIHTLSECEVCDFFQRVAKVVKVNDPLFLEYRNDGDVDRRKVTPDHFRAFYTSDFIAEKAAEYDLECIYQVEGVGFAKWKQDDASVTRQIFQKNKV